MAREAEELAAQAQRLRELKKQARGVTFGKIATAVGVTERQAQRWFAGDSDIDAGRLPKLARFLGTTPDYIEYGVLKRTRSPTPDLSVVREEGSVEQRLARIEKTLSAMTEMLGEAQVARAANVMAVLRRLDEEEPPSEDSLSETPE